MRNLISLDGGGLRAIPYVCAIAGAERRSGKLFRDLIGPDGMVAGTSAGALTGAAVAVGIPGEDILKVFTNDAPVRIFHGLLSTEEMVLRGYKYLSGDIYKVMEKTFKDHGV